MPAELANNNGLGSAGVPHDPGGTPFPHGVGINEAGNGCSPPFHDPVESRTFQLRCLIGIDGVAGIASLERPLTTCRVAGLDPNATAGNSKINAPAMHRAGIAPTRSICSFRMPDHANALGPRFRNPCLTLATNHLTHVGICAIARKALEFLGCRIKTRDGISRPL